MEQTSVVSPSFPLSSYVERSVESTRENGAALTFYRNSFWNNRAVDSREKTNLDRLELRNLSCHTSSQYGEEARVRYLCTVIYIVVADGRCGIKNKRGGDGTGEKSERFEYYYGMRGDEVHASLR